MTADGFDMKQVSFIGRGEWVLRIAEGDSKFNTTVYDDAVQECIADSFDHISDTVKNEILCRLDSAWDEGKVTDEERDNFARILEKVVG